MYLHVCLILFGFDHDTYHWRYIDGGFVRDAHIPRQDVLGYPR